MNLQAIKKFQQLVGSPVLFRLYLLSKLPMGFLAGLRVEMLDDTRCVASVRYGYLNKNPFHSIYFACLSMAAELSTGVLCMQFIQGQAPPVSTLVTGLTANFTKKAKGKISFTCTDGAQILSAIARSKETGEGEAVVCTSIGTDEAGDKVAEFKITWSFKVKSNT